MKRCDTKRLLILVLAIFLAACSAGGQEPAPKRTEMVIATMNPYGINSELRKAVGKFNRSHKDVRVTIKNYWGDTPEEAQQKQMQLKTEIASGKMPDIIDIGQHGTWMKMLPYHQLVEKGYLEDLWPYIENDPELGKEALFLAPLKAAEVDGGLYTIFNSVRLNTCVGAKRVVGERYGWTPEELWEAYRSMPENSTVFMKGFTQYSVFSRILCMNLDSYVNWETGQCDFDREDFRSALEFVKSSSAEVRFPETQEEIKAIDEERYAQMEEGRLMLSDVRGFVDMQYMDIIYREPVSFVGYPTADGSAGSSFDPRGNKMSISSTCKDKDAAWEIIRHMLLPQYESPDDFGRNYLDFIVAGVPINLSDYDMQKRAYMSNRLGTRSMGNIYFHKATEEEFQRYEDFLSHIEKVELYDCTLLDLVWECCGAYLAGDKSIDETITLIENRVGLYINEVK